jgi:hypothetical protein
MTTERKTTANRRLAQYRAEQLIEHSNSYQLLWSIDSFVLQIRHCAKRQNVISKV